MDRRELLQGLAFAGAAGVLPMVTAAPQRGVTEMGPHGYVLHGNRVIGWDVSNGKTFTTVAERRDGAWHVLDFWEE